MSAPSNTVWGSIVNDKAKLGISINPTAITDSNVSFRIEVWLALKWNINDSSNTLRFTYTDGSSPTGYTTLTETNLALNFGTTSGSGWSESASQQKVYEFNDTWTRVSTDRTLEFSSSLGPLASAGYTVSASASYTVPAIPARHTVAYNANGGTGAPESQTKVYGHILTLSSVTPTRSYYNFRIWNTAQNGSGTDYSPGGLYGYDEDVTLYAQWSPYTHTVSYNANGGTGAPASQTKTYGSSLYVSNTIPTRKGYKFTSWNTAQDGTGTSYSPGQQYMLDRNGGTVTLYAQWEIANVAYIKQNGRYIPGNVFFKVNGQWCPAIPYVRDNGTYKQSTI